MEYTTLGSTGTRVSQLAFGTWRFGRESGGVLETTREEAHDLLDAAWDRGINFIDTANRYGNPHGTAEQYVGEWLEDYDREDFVLASKVYFPFNGRTGGEREPGPNDSGLGRKHVRAQVEGYESFAVTQPLFHAGYRDDITDYLDVCIDQGLAVCPYSPLAGGFLTGKYERTGEDPTDFEGPDGARGDIYDSFEEYYLSERGWQVLDELRAVADDLDATPAQVALRWLIEQPDFTCVPIVGARTAEQLAENAGAVDVSLSDDQFQRIVDARYAEPGTRYGHRW